MSGDGGTKIPFMTAAQRLSAIREVLRAQKKTDKTPEQALIDIEALIEGWQ